MEISSQKEFSVVEAVRTLVQGLKYILYRWWIVGIVSAIFGTIGVLYAWSTDPKYTAEMTFVAESESKGGLGMYAGIAAQFGLDVGGGGGGAFEGENLIELLKSRTLIENTLLTPLPPGNHLLIEEYLTINEINKGWSKDPKYNQIKFEAEPKTFNRTRDSILLAVYENIVNTKLDIQKKDKKTNIIAIRYTDVHEMFSKVFVEMLTDKAIDYYTDYKSKKARQNVDILQRQTDSVKRMLYGSISSVAAINDLNVNPIRQTVRVGSQLRQVDAQVNGTLYGELLKNLELAKLTLRKEMPLIQVIDKPKLPLVKKKPGRLKTGLIFAFIGAFLTISLLLIRHWFLINKTRLA